MTVLVDTFGEISVDVIPEFEYRKVRIKGSFDDSKEILIQSRTRDGELGFHLITPFLRSDGGQPILINRGFLKREFREPSSRSSPLVRLFSSSYLS